MEFKSLPPHKQCIAILFAKTFCQIADLWDCRGIVKETDYADKLQAMGKIDELTTLLFKCFDKLNTTNVTKEKETKIETKPAMDIGVELQRLLSNDSSDIK
ncbi:hypothetical protein C4585_01580 [Candidatus Parcubacteria bacterium]|nr:MAG: hypothetical protein C4585_01580 [Candidatus Parcubacteria bacterium]